MAEKKIQNKRIENLLSAEEIPETIPKSGMPQKKRRPKKQRKEVAQKEALSFQQDTTKVSWDEFLNAIDRDERIGFQYAGDEIAPLSEKLNSQDGSMNALLQLGGDIFGKIQLDGTENLSPEEKALVETIAQQVSQHIENLRLVEQANQYRHEAEAASREMTQKGWEEYLKTSNAPARGYFYDQKRVTTTNDLETLVDMVNGEITTRSIAIRDEPIGKVTLADAEESTAQTQAMLATVIDRLGAHIENLRLLDETERGRQQLDKRAAELETVAKVSTAAAAIRDPESLLRSVVDLTNFSFNLYHTSVHLLQEDENGNQYLELTAASGKLGHQMLQDGHKIPYKAKKSIVATSARNMAVEICNDAKKNKNFLSHPLLPDARSEMAIPMVVADKLLGVFDVQSEAPNRFTEEDKRTYTTLAAQTAVALQNALLYQEQLETVERLRELDQLKSSFLANMSHELRTPLNSISGFTQVMLEGLDGELTPEMEDDLGLIDKNANHLLNLINEVLDMAKIEAGRLSVSVEPTNLYQIIEDVVKSTAGLARENDLSMELDNQLDPEKIIILDGMRIQQVMINLIGNAMKFTPQGGINVTAEEDNDIIRIIVKDTGIGIPPEQLESIFEAFSQVDTSTTRKVGGTGLGLPISRRFVEMHNGRLWAESTGITGEGTSLIMELPIRLPE